MRRLIAPIAIWILVTWVLVFSHPTWGQITPQAARLLHEKDWVARVWKVFQTRYREAGAHTVVKEHTLYDGTEVDLMTPDHAVEFDWSRKWAESIGQSLHYANQTDRVPGIVLLVEERSVEMKYVQRCKALAIKYGIEMWVVDTKRARLYRLDGTWVSIPK